MGQRMLQMSNKTIMGMILILIGVVMTASPAFAQESAADRIANIFSSEFGDTFSSIYLNLIFGPLFPTPSGESETRILAVIIKFLNLFVLVLGGVLFFWNATVGLLQTAHEGQILGQRWSSLWAPLRVVFAVGMLIPLPGLQGYNLGQAGVAFLVKGTTTFASILWEETAEMITSGAVLIAEPASTVDIDFVEAVYKINSCRNVYEHYFNQAAAGANSPRYRIGAEPRKFDFDGNGYAETVFNTFVTKTAPGASGPSSDQSSLGVCGSVTLPSPPDYLVNAANGKDTDGVNPIVTQENAKKAIEIYDQMYSQAFVNLFSGMGIATTKALPFAIDDTSRIPDISPEIINAYNEFQNNISVGNKNVRDAMFGQEKADNAIRSMVIDRVKGACSNSSSSEEAPNCYGEGWMGAGQWYMFMAQYSNEVAAISQGEFNTEEPILKLDSCGWLKESFGNCNEATTSTPEMENARDRMMRIYYSSAHKFPAGGFPVDFYNNMENPNNPSADDSWFTKAVLKKLSSPVDDFRDYMIGYLDPSYHTSGGDPLVGAGEIGAHLIYVGGVISLVGGALPIAVFLGKTALTFGAILKFVLPLLPFFIWIMAITGYLLLVIQSVVAISLWLMGHIRLDGEGISGESGKRGWMILLSVSLTPPLMIIGFIVGMILMRITGSLLTIGLGQAIALNPESNIFLEIVQILAIPGMLAVFFLFIVERSFSLVTEFPGQVLRWVDSEYQDTIGADKIMTKAIGAGAGGAAGIAVAGKTVGSVASKGVDLITRNAGSNTIGKQ